MISNKARDAMLKKFGTPKPTLLESQNIIDTSTLPIEKEIGNQLEMTLESVNNDTKNVQHSKYKGLELLNSGEPKLRKGNTITIVFYNEMTNFSNTFILFGLLKNDNDILNFPDVKYSGDKKPSSFVIEKLKNAFNEWENAEFEYRGYLREEHKTYLWIEGKIINNYEPLKGSASGKWWFALVSEIVNNKKLLYFPIHESVTDIFMRKPELCYLVDEFGVTLEIPNVAYYGGYYKRIAYAAALGQRKEGPKTAFGPYYYFNSYPRAIRYAIWTVNFEPMEIDGELITEKDSGKFIKGGIVRFAIFPGKHNMFLNRDSDPDDISEYTKQLIQKDLFWKNSIKVRDSDGKWTKEYDSIGLGNRPYLSKNSKKEKILYNQQVVKNYDQQIALTYYYVNTDQDTENLPEVKIE